VGIVIALFAVLLLFAIVVIVRIERMSRPPQAQPGPIEAKQFIPAHLGQVPFDGRGGVSMRAIRIPDQWAFDVRTAAGVNRVLVEKDVFDAHAVGDLFLPEGSLGR